MLSRPLIKIDETSPVSREAVGKHLLYYFYSLKNFPDQYLNRFFLEINNPPNHFAYLCPLCLQDGILLEQTIGLGCHSDFSLDHCPPESVADHYSKILVCKKCNNNAGGIYEKSIKDMMQDLSFNNGTASSKLLCKAKIINGPGRDQVPGRYTSMLSINEEGKMDIELKPKSSDKIPPLDKWIAESKNDLNYKIELTVPKADSTKVTKSLLKAAYLYCFEYWGYEFVYSITGERIREVLNNGREYPVRTPFFWLRNTIELNNIPYTPLGICYLQKPEDCKCFIINMMLTDKVTGYKNIASILIPGPTPEAWDDLKRIETFFDRNDDVNIALAHVIDQSIDNVTDGYTQSWIKLQSQ